ncbi:MAG: AAA family ATPase [Chloroflexaceae bacterium]|nr:AAA family ATPase [Chloroflexaceae bacterium]
MNRFFNTAGPCNPNDHYMLPAAARLPEVTRLIAQKLYFVLHAPRQTGKTTALLTLAQELTAEGAYTAVLVSMEVGAAFNDNPGEAEEAILGRWRGAADWQLPADLQPPPWPEASPGEQIAAALTAWAKASLRPLVVFLDEIDALQDTTLISVLRQLRDGYAGRPRAFPWSLALIGLRDVRDYKVASGGSDRLHTASPFNIKAESLTLRNFTAAEVAALYQQHTDETGQVFTPDATARAFYLTQGQPWLVNALARQLTEVLVPDQALPITPAHVDQAKELLIQRQDTHLDSLAERLRDPRIRQVIEPMLAGQTVPDIPVDTIRLVQDLGLCRTDPLDGLVVANPIYREIIPQMLSYALMTTLPRLTPIWLTPDGKLDPSKLLEAFLAFWKQHGQPLLKSAPYHEIAPHLVMMAFLHRVINAGGTIEREYAIGKDSMDLCVRYGGVTLAIELKTWRDRDKKRDPRSKGLEQLDAYLAGLGLDTGWLVIFDQREGLPDLAERTTTEPATTPAGRSVVVVRG